jgi:hypothetical protein
VNSADGRQSLGLNVSSYVSPDANLIQPDAAGCALAGHTPPLAPSSVDSPGGGNKSEVSLTGAAYAEVGQAAGSRQGGQDKDGLIVRKPNVDPQNLDAIKDGTACGPGLTSRFSSPSAYAYFIGASP